MSAFESIHYNALKHSHNNGSIKYQTCLFPSISNDAKEHLFYILNYAKLQANPLFNITFNSMDSYLILYTISGEGILTYDNQSYSLLPQTILFIDCHKSFHVKTSGKIPWSYHRIYFNGNASPLLYQSCNVGDPQLLHCATTSGTYQSINKLVRYIQNNDVNELVSSMLLNILLTETVLESNEANLQASIPAYVLQVQHLFDTQYYNNYSLDTLAQQFHVNKYRLAKDFKRYLHTSPIDYLITVRILIAKQLLSDTDYTVTEIASQTGIFDTTHFINLFKKRVGLTPLEYRKKQNTDVSVFY